MQSKKILFLYLVTILLSSCSLPKGYISTTQNVPLLSEKGDMEIVGTIGIDHFEAQMAFSPVKHVGVIGSLYATNFGTTGDIGIGYNFKDKHDNICEIYVLSTNSKFAKLKSYSFPLEGDHYDVNMNVDYNGFGVQANIGKKYKKATYAIGLGYKNVNYDYFKYHLTKTHKFDDYKPYDRVVIDTNYILPTKNNNIITIAPTIKIGKGLVKYYFQASIHVILNKTISIDDKPFNSPLVITNGILFDLGYLRVKKNKNIN